MERSVKRFELLLISVCAAVPLFFLRATKDCFLLPKYTLISLAAAIAAVMWAGLCLRARTSFLVGRRGRAAFVLGQLFFFSVFLSVPFSGNMALTLAALPLWAGYYAFFMTALLALRSARVRALFADVLCAVAGVVSVYALFQYFDMDFFGWNLDPGDIRAKAFSTFGNPQIMAVWLGGAMPLMLAAMLGSYASSSRADAWKVLLRTAALALAFGAMFVSHARTGLISLAVGFAVVLVFYGAVNGRIRDNVRKYVKTWIAVIGLILAATLFTPFYSGAPGRAGLKSETFAGRWITWTVTADIIRSNPLCGTGPGTFSYFYPLGLKKFFARHEDPLALPRFAAVRRDWAHNDFLQVASESGLVAAALLTLFALFVFVFGLRVVLRMLRLRESGRFSAQEQRDILGRAGVLASFCALCATALFHFMLFNPSSGLLFFALCGAMLNLAPDFEAAELAAREKAPSAFWRVIAVETAAVLVLLVFAQFSAKPFASDLLVRRGHSLMSAGRNADACAAFERSLELYPAGGQARFFYGLSLMREGDSKGAVLQFAAVLDTMVSEMVYFALGNCSMKLWNLEAARDAFSGALALNPFFHDARINRGIVEYKLGNGAAARTDFMLAAATSSSDFIRMNAYTNLGAVCYRDAGPEEALEFWQEALRLKTDDATLEGHIKEAVRKARARAEGAL